ncbi:OLEOSIN [Salix purpurea]|uniref:OLEOSIN n=1 Tax=Salix purpurea TaxID=77065 RepID=A0A9Q1A728_SALPP|nr:OLEOSIN [Salix purpurea]
MADFRQQQLRPGGQGTAGILHGKGPSTSQVLAAVTLSPVGCTLLFLAALVIGLGVLGFLTSAAFVVTALSSFSWMVNYIRSLSRGSCHGNWIEQNGGHRKWQEK